MYKLPNLQGCQINKNKYAKGLELLEGIKQILMPLPIIISEAT